MVNTMPTTSCLTINEYVGLLNSAWFRLYSSVIGDGMVALILTRCTRVITLSFFMLMLTSFKDSKRNSSQVILVFSARDVKSPFMSGPSPRTMTIVIGFILRNCAEKEVKVKFISSHSEERVCSIVCV